MTLVPPKKKFLGVNLKKNVYEENYRTLVNEIKKKTK